MKITGVKTFVVGNPPPHWGGQNWVFLKLYEAGLHELCDAVIFVDADWAARVERVAAARGWTEDELRRRENLLNPLDRKRTIADHVVVNHSSIGALRSEVERVFSSVLATFTD